MKDKWYNCPRCYENSVKELNDLRKQVTESYGKIPEKEYLKLKESVVNYEIDISENLGVYHRFWFEGFTLKWHFEGYCETCGFSVDLNGEVELKSPNNS